MENMRHFSIPFKGLKNGNHHFRFEVDNDFFLHFDNDEIRKGQFIVEMDMEKKPGLSIMEFQLKGHALVNCDRCTANIHLPVEGNYRMLLKFGDESESNEEVMFVDPEISILPLAQLIYEFIILSIPMVKMYNCEIENPRPCNMEILKKLDSNMSLPKDDNSIWDSLKGINFENN